MMIKIFAVITALCVVLFLIDLIGSKRHSFYGSIVDKHYKAESNSIGTGLGTTSNGKVVTVVTSQHESEKFLLMVKKENGDILTVKCDPELYYKKEIGQTVECYEYKGKFSGFVFFSGAIR